MTARLTEKHKKLEGEVGEAEVFVMMLKDEV
jgi:hypothetical protein